MATSCHSEARGDSVSIEHLVFDFDAKIGEHSRVRLVNRASPVPILGAMEMNGVAHIQLTVRDFAACRVFYAKLFSWLDMQVIFDSPQIFYGVGSRTGIAISPADEPFRDARFEQRRVGLHHFCLRARRREDIDEMHEFLKSIGAHIVHPPEEARWAPGYYSVLFEDPDGIRLEANYVPGKGNLAADVVLPLDVDRVTRGT